MVDLIYYPCIANSCLSLLFDRYNNLKDVCVRDLPEYTLSSFSPESR